MLISDVLTVYVDGIKRARGQRPVWSALLVYSGLIWEEQPLVYNVQGVFTKIMWEVHRAKRAKQGNITPDGGWICVLIACPGDIML